MTYFSFSLEEFAREILDVIDVLRELKRYKQSYAPRSYRWLLFWSRKERTHRPWKFPLPGPKVRESPPVPATRHGAMNFKIWRALERLRKPEIKFAVKVGFGAALLALPGFSDRYREMYTHWRGEWALLSYFVIIALSVGGTTSTALWRYITIGMRLTLEY
jgi:Fusaric acid resistance protein-like